MTSAERLGLPDDEIKSSRASRPEGDWVMQALRWGGTQPRSPDSFLDPSVSLRQGRGTQLPLKKGT